MTGGVKDNEINGLMAEGAVSPAGLETLRTHARTIVEGEGAEESSSALVEAVARAIAQIDHNGRIAEPGYWADPCTGCNLYRTMARAALSTIRKHQAGE